MPSSGKPESGWIAIGSHAAQRAPGLMCGALLNKKNKFQKQTINKTKIMELEQNGNGIKTQ